MAQIPFAAAFRIAAMPSMRYAARLRGRLAKYNATSFLVAPILRRDRTIRSMLTEESAASIFATLDWLEPRSRPSCCWVIPRRTLCSFIACPSPIFISMMVVSSSFKPKNSAAFPIFHPADSNFFSFRLSIFELIQLARWTLRRGHQERLCQI